MRLRHDRGKIAYIGDPPSIRPSCAVMPSISAPLPAPSRARPIVLSGVVLMFAALIAACAPAPLPRVAGNGWPGYWPLFLAVAESEVPIAHVTELTSTTAVMRAYRNGSIDVAMLTLDEALQLAAEGFDVCVVLVLDVSAGGDALVAKPSFRHLTELAGKHIGVERSALGAYMTTRALAHAGLGADAVSIVDVPFGDHVAALRQGRVDAVVTFEPARSVLLAEGARELFSSAQLPGEIVDVLVTRASYLRAHRRELARLVAAWRQGVATIERDPARAFGALAGFAAGQRQRFDEALAGIRLPGAAEQRNYLEGELARLAVSLQQIMLDHGLLATPVRGTLRIDPSLFGGSRS